MTKLCDNCRHYQPLSAEGSGIANPDGNGEWVYVVGQCQQSASCHHGRDNLPSWVSCEYWRRRAGR